MLTVSLLSGAGGTTGGMSAVTTAMTDVLNFVGSLLDTITANPVLCFILAASFVTVGIGVFSNLKNSIG